MKPLFSRTERALNKAKKEVKDHAFAMASDEDKIELGFLGGGYIVSLSVIAPVYKAVMLFIKGCNKIQIASKIKNFPEAMYFIQENPSCVISIRGAGLQHPFRAEGAFYEQKKM